MCQMRVLVVDEVGEELVMENVTSLQVSGDTIEVGAFFEEPRKIDAVCIQSIDFLGGKVLLTRKPA